MGISYIPGPEQLLAPAATQISEAVVNYMRPDLKFQRAMQMQLGQNPALIQQFADVEANAPGTLARLGFGQLGSMISQTSQSAVGRGEAAQRPGAAANAVSAQEADTAKNMYTADNIKTAAALVREKPELAFDAALRLVSGETAAERSQNEDKATVSKLTTDQIEQGKLKANKNQPAIPPEQLQKDARMMANGQLDGSLLNTYLNNNEVREGFLLAVDVERDRMTREAATAERIARGESGNLNQRQAFQRYRDTDAGTVSAWQEYLGDPKIKEKVKVLQARKYETLTIEEKDLLEVARSDEFELAANRIGKVNQYNVVLSNGIAAIRKMHDENVGESLIQAQVAGLNDNLSQKNQLTGQQIRAVFGKEDGSGWFGMDKTRLHFVDQDGKVVKEGTVLSPYAPQSVEADISARVTRAAMMLSGQNLQERQASLERIKNDPQVSAKMYDSIVAAIADTTKKDSARNKK